MTKCIGCICYRCSHKDYCYDNHCDKGRNDSDSFDIYCDTNSKDEDCYRRHCVSH